MIEVTNLHKAFGDQQVLRGVSMQFARNKVTTVIGRSGCGKSVLMNHLIGLMKPDQGSVIVEGTDLTSCSSKRMLEVRKLFGFLFQDSALFDSMNVLDNVGFPLVEHTRLARKEIEEIVARKLALVGLQGVEGKMPSELSGGMRKRVALARAIALDPKIIVYDEPTTGLDPIMSDQVNRLIFNTQRALQVTSIVISHDIKATFAISDFVGLLHQGQLAIFGTPSELRASANPVVHNFLEGISDAHEVD